MKAKIYYSSWFVSILFFALFICILSLATADDDDDDDDELNIEELTIRDIQKAFRDDDDLTCSQLLERYLDRINRLDQDLAGGWPINSVLWINEHARTRAAELDRYYKVTGKLMGPLHCVPILLKDNYDTVDMPTTAGSLAMLGAQPSADATTVRKLRQAGALLLGKATMDAWAMGAGGESSRPRAGNPYNTAFLTSSSSSGSAAAVSANFTMVATGSDTCGSLTSPGSVNGVVAIRSSYGLVSQKGIVPLAGSHDVGGPLARTVEDAVKVLNVMAGVDPADPVTMADPTAERYSDYTRFLDKKGAKGKRIGVLRTYGPNATPATPTAGSNQSQAAAFNAALAVLQKKGATLVDPINFDNFNGTYLADWDAEVDLNHYLANTNAPLANLTDLVNNALVHPNAKARVLDRIIPQFDKGTPEYEVVTQGNLEAKRRFDNLMDEHNLDALVLLGDRACQVSVTTGIPFMVVPAGFRTEGDARGVGLGIMARKWDEPTMISIAYAYEQASKSRRPPKVATSLSRKTKLLPLQPSVHNACVEKIALKARELQGSNFRDITPEDYLQYIRQADCTLDTHAAAGVK